MSNLELNWCGDQKLWELFHQDAGVWSLFLISERVIWLVFCLFLRQSFTDLQDSGLFFILWFGLMHSAHPTYQNVFPSYPGLIKNNSTWSLIAQSGHRYSDPPASATNLELGSCIRDSSLSILPHSFDFNYATSRSQWSTTPNHLISLAHIDGFFSRGYEYAGDICWDLVCPDTSYWAIQALFENLLMLCFIAQAIQFRLQSDVS
jgi:hypothetical protein